jgi:hypothetical protein
MAGSWTSERFPQFEQQIRALMEQHRELEDEPLHLAISYGPLRDQEDIFLFEVAGGEESVNPDRDFFEVTFKSVPGLQTGFSQPLHLVLTNPQEFKKALAEGWPLAKEVVSAVQADAYKVLYKDAVGDRLLRQIRAAARRKEEVPRG